ncbi:MAG TPA: TIGR00266 family protein [Armatimonadetes bacterium]|nr:TIGR00266 family protein [Armatimonadota bacterium]
MEYVIRGTVMQSVEVTLQQGEGVFTEAGGMSWMTANITMDTNMKGGLMGALKRAASGESLFMTDYTCASGTGFVTFTPEVPGKILVQELAPGQSIICQRDAFMVAQAGVQLEMHMHRRLGAMFFGGEGLFMQKVTGPGLAFFEIDGEVVEYNLQAGQGLKIDPGHVAMMDPTVTFDIAQVPGFKNILLGGEGLFLATVTGPGRVWLQTMPVPNLAMRLIPYLPKSSD